MRYTKAICAAVAVMLLLAVGSAALQRKSDPPMAGKETLLSRESTQPEPSYTPQEKRSLLQIQYPQVAAWLSIPGVGLEEPVAEAPDDEFYFSHDFTGREDPLGALFFGVGHGPERPVILLFGPSNTPGALFSKLAAYRDPAFLAANPAVQLALADGTQQWEMSWLRVMDVDELHEIVDERAVEPGESLLLLVTEAEDFPGARLVIAAKRQAERAES